MSSNNKMPAKPDPKEYEHLNQKERMLAGYPYRPGYSVLREERSAARKLTSQFNNSDAQDKEGRRNILKQLLNPSCRDNKIFIEPPFRCDYGYNITIGNNVEMNFDCVFLDCASITIGKNCLIAPGVHIYAATHPIDAKHRQDNDDYYELAFPITIGDNVWIGGKAIICPGVTIGDNSVIGAGTSIIQSFVFKAKLTKISIYRQCGHEGCACECCCSWKSRQNHPSYGCTRTRGRKIFIILFYVNVPISQ